MLKDHFKAIVEDIVADLEQGRRPWLRPWDANTEPGQVRRPLRATGEPYSGINVLLLWMAAIRFAYASPTWMTFRMASELGGHVRAGEKATHIVFTKTRTVTDRAAGEDAGGEETSREVRVLKSYAVFNAEQIDGLPEKYAAPPPRPLLEPRLRMKELDDFLYNTRADIRHGGGRACYMPGPDRIYLPDYTSFRRPAAYFSTALHELVHWTGHPKRLAREFGKAFGDEAYAREELTAELGSAFLCADLGLKPDVREDHAPYLGHWADVLREEPRALFRHAAQGQRAADWLRDLQPRLLEQARAPEARP